MLGDEVLQRMAETGKLGNVYIYLDDVVETVYSAKTRSIRV
jgi:hypothetical protein